MKLRKILVLISVFVLILPALPTIGMLNTYPEEGLVIPTFEFTHTNNTIIDITSYTGKPTVLEWSASWCNYCSSNHGIIKNLHSEFKNEVNFLSISYNLSGDTLADVIDMKGSFEWDFGLDHTNYGVTTDVSNAHTWLLDENLTLVSAWKHTVISENTLRQQINSLLNNETSSSSPGVEQWVLDLFFKNPLIIGFTFLVVITIGFIIISKFRK